MSTSQDSRKAELSISYNGKDISASLAKSLLDFTYTDAESGSQDDLQISLEDKERLWQGDWQPTEGDTIKAEIKVSNWHKANEVSTLPCGTFSVDSFGFSGPPDTVSIKALALPVSASIRHEKRSKVWEKVKLSTIASEIAKRAGLELFYDTNNDPTYNHIEQQEQSDMAFLLEVSIKEGIAIKASSGTLILFDEVKFEQQEAMIDIVRGESNVLSYDFDWSTVDVAYVACENNYEDTDSKKTIKVLYRPSTAPNAGPVLRISEQADSEAAALRLCKARLREKNKESNKARFTLAGDVRLASSVTVNVEGWGRFDGKYIIESAGHKVGSNGYTVDLSARKVLGW